jgi:hypothetical protein
VQTHITTNPILPDEANIYYNTYKRELCDVAQILNKNRTLTLGNGNRITTLIDEVLDVAFNYTANTQKILDHISNVHKELLKGITHFDTNTDVQRPVYHRAQSCGSRSPNALRELNCSNTYHDTDESSRRARKVRNCLLERLVYNELFRKYHPTEQQNFGHENMILNIERSHNKFMSCFPSTTMHVRLFWTNDNLFPKGMMVTTSSPTKTKVEMYRKSMQNYDPLQYNVEMIELLNDNVSNIYAQDVECLRLIYDRETYMYIENEKTQSFQIESPWRENVVTTLQMGGTSTLTKLHKT